jgi:hypothetical protein
VKLACVYERTAQGRPEKYVSICYDNQIALKAFQAAKTMSPLVRVPKGVEYLYPAHRGAVLGPWTCRGTWKINPQQARMGRLHSEVYRT